jgi:dolichol-phosphate mannosyltransferase
MVIGSRYVPGGGTSEWGWTRAVLSWLANRYIRLVAGVPIRDTTSGYRAYRREVLEETDFDRIKIKGYVVHGEMAYQAWIHGFRLGEVPIHFRNRRRDASKLTSEEIYMALINFALLRFRYGFRPRPRRRSGDGAS